MKDLCNGCGNKYDDCICKELDEEMNEGKHKDDDPNDGNYQISAKCTNEPYLFHGVILCTKCSARIR